MRLLFGLGETSARDRTQRQFDLGLPCGTNRGFALPAELFLIFGVVRLWMRAFVPCRRAISGWIVVAERHPSGDFQDHPRKSQESR